MKYEKSMDISQFTPTLGLNKKDDRMAGSSWTRVLVSLLTLPNTNLTLRISFLPIILLTSYNFAEK